MALQQIERSVALNVPRKTANCLHSGHEYVPGQKFENDVCLNPKFVAETGNFNRVDNSICSGCTAHSMFDNSQRIIYIQKSEVD